LKIIIFYISINLHRRKPATLRLLKRSHPQINFARRTGRFAAREAGRRSFARACLPSGERVDRAAPDEAKKIRMEQGKDAVGTMSCAVVGPMIARYDRPILFSPSPRSRGI
jgi:hypothetical protein